MYKHCIFFCCSLFIILYFLHNVLDESGFWWFHFCYQMKSVERKTKIINCKKHKLVFILKSFCVFTSYKNLRFEFQFFLCFSPVFHLLCYLFCGVHFVTFSCFAITRKIFFMEVVWFLCKKHINSSIVVVSFVIFKKHWRWKRKHKCWVYTTADEYPASICRCTQHFDVYVMSIT